MLRGPHGREALLPTKARRDASCAASCVVRLGSGATPWTPCHLRFGPALNPFRAQSAHRHGALDRGVQASHRHTNLARRILELHTLGLRSAYTQDDCRIEIERPLGGMLVIVGRARPWMQLSNADLDQTKQAPSSSTR
jgi:hypothetical protein